MYKTTNDTTVEFEQCSATIIEDSTFNGHRIISIECVYPRIIHAEVLRHKDFSNSVSSSRATPVDRIIEDCTYVPSHFYRNQRGMVGGEEFSPEESAKARDQWIYAREAAIASARRLSEMGVHKQHVNRLLEPFSFVRHLITATRWERFFTQRLAKDADPVIQTLAQCIHQSIRLSVPVRRGDHYPYVLVEERDSLPWDQLPLVSAARCARLSYLKHDGTRSTIEEDLALFERLSMDGHWSPMEHTATSRPLTYANFDGWRSLRSRLGH